MVYADMLARLDYGDRDPERVRAEFDQRLGVAGWRTPAGTRRPEQLQVELPDVGAVQAPAWWRGEEEASQSFLASAGVITRG